MIDIYNLDPNERDFLNSIKIELTCHTFYGYENDSFGRFFEKGKKYKATLEPIKPGQDTGYKPCTLIWVSFNENYGSRFAVVGNICVDFWPHFTKVFNCPIEEMRDLKIKELGI